MTLFFPSQVISLFSQIILAMLKRGGVCLYYKENLSLWIITVSFHSQCVLCEVTIQRQKGYVIVIYWSPCQTTVEFDKFLSNFEKLFNFVKQLQPSFTIKLGDFNVRSKSWWPDDITSPEGTDIDSLTTVHGLQQLISGPTHYYQIHYPALISFLLINPTWQLIVAFILPYILIVIIKLFIVNSILWLSTLPHMKV